MPTYTFDVKIWATVRVSAPNEEAARRLMAATLDGSSANLGAWPGGEPIVTDISLEEGDSPSELVEIDGEAV